MMKMKEWQRRMFVEYAAEYDEIAQARGVTNSFIEALTQLLDSEILEGNILDLCCGSGRLLPALAKRAKSVTGVDFSLPFIEIARKRYTSLENIELVCGDARQLLNLLKHRRYNLICRSYTSIGYFSFEEELGILKDCLELTSDTSVLVVDTFNGEWLTKNQAPKRSNRFGRLTLTEVYRYNPQRDIVDCEWLYKRDLEDAEETSISFKLEVYRPERLEKLIQQTGWGIPSLYCDYSTAPLVEAKVPPERIVAVCKRNRS
jgi:SAM-dependent methyltransferase